MGMWDRKTCAYVATCSPKGGRCGENCCGKHQLSLRLCQATHPRAAPRRAQNAREMAAYQTEIPTAVAVPCDEDKDENEELDALLFEKKAVSSDDESESTSVAEEYAAQRMSNVGIATLFVLLMLFVSSLGGWSSRRGRIASRERVRGVRAARRKDGVPPFGIRVAEGMAGVAEGLIDDESSEGATRRGRR